MLEVTPVRLLIAGSRSVTSLEQARDAVCEAFAAWDLDWVDVVELVSGGAKGVDQLGEALAKEHNVEIRRFIPDWKNLTAPGARVRTNQFGAYNANAGIDRNGLLVARCTHAVVLWDGSSPGTNDTIKRLAAANKPYHLAII